MKGRSPLQEILLEGGSEGAVYAPEDVTLLELIFEDVCARATPHVPLNDGVRNLLASAILEGASQGIRDRERLASFALRAIPAFRSERMANEG